MFTATHPTGTDPGTDPGTDLSGAQGTGVQPGAGAGRSVSAGEVAAFRVRVGSVSAGTDTAQALAVLEELERLRRGLTVVMARVATGFVDLCLHELAVARAGEDAARAATGEARSQVPVSARRIRASAGAEAGLAMRSAPRAGQRFVAWSQTLLHDLPLTAAALAAGEISDRDAQAVVAEVQGLTPDECSQVDTTLTGHFGTGSSRQLRTHAHMAAAHANIDAVLARARQAPTGRYVSARPLGEGMTNLTAHLPTPDAAAALTALTRYADQIRADGSDPRSNGQAMADELVERLTGYRASTHPHPADDQATPATQSRKPSPHTCRPHCPCDDEPDTDDRPDDHDSAAQDGHDPHHQHDTRHDVTTRGESDHGDDNGPTETNQTTQPSPDSSPPSPDGPSPEGKPKPHQPRVGACGHCGTIDNIHERVPIELNLIITDTTLFGDDPTPALLHGEPIPAFLARQLSTDPHTHVSLRRLYLHPTTHQLVAMESTRRLFTGNLKRLRCPAFFGQWVSIGPYAARLLSSHSNSTSFGIR